ncbi:MAG TPA: type II secretion system protein [Patescibacteria group bacterium]|nr:type II secretion system protein [Patescibacteria group bacterium]
MISFKGQTLVELLLVIGLATIILPGLMVGLIASRGGRAQQDQQLQASTQIQQIQEAMRSIRESGWSNIATDGVYHPVVNGSIWTLASGSATLNGYTQQVTISDVYRDSNDNIVSTGGTLDPSTKLLTTTVSWNTPYPSSLKSLMYLTRYLNSASDTDTTVNDFSTGSQSGTIITNVNGGEVSLSTSGNADWCNPQNSLINTLTLPKQGNTISALPGGAYVGTGDGTQGVTFVNVGISQPNPPTNPVATVSGTFSSNYQTNAIFSDGRYIYLAANGSSSQVIILDITKTPYTKVGWIDVPGGDSANGIYVVNNTAFVTSGDSLYTFDITNKTGDHKTPLDSSGLINGVFGIFSNPNQTAQQVVVANNNVYVSTTNSLFGLQVFSVDSNGQLNWVGLAQLSWQQAAQGLTISTDGKTVYMAFDGGVNVNGSGAYFSKGFFIIDVAHPDSILFFNWYPTIGWYNTGSTDPAGIAVPTANRAIIVGSGGTQQYLVIDITNPASPMLCGGMAISSGISGVSSVTLSNNTAYSYIITGESKNQFKIIQGGSGGAFTMSGIYESATFNPGFQASFDSFQAVASQPASTQIKLQVAVAAPLNGNCANAVFTYLGPNSDPNQYFTPIGSSLSASIPFGTINPNYQNPGNCYRFKAFLSTTTATQSPSLNSITTSYSQ